MDLDRLRSTIWSFVADAFYAARSGNFQKQILSVGDTFKNRDPLDTARMHFPLATRCIITQVWWVLTDKISVTGKILCSKNM